nr:CBM35 domain-containing protein [Micromonospora sp. DSM 115978]
MRSTRSRLDRRAVAATLSVVVTGATALVVGLTPGAASAANSTLTVNAGTPFRPVTQVGAGGLYALAENNRPVDAMLLPLKMHTITQPPPGATHRPNGQPPGGDALLVAPQATRVGAAEYIRMPDIYPDFPYRWVSWNDWYNKVDTQVRARLGATGTSNVTGWELWNEPDWTWNTSAAGSFNAGWVQTFRRVRALDPLTPIVGPSTAVYNEGWMRSFLTHARDNNALPDIICWHELEGSHRIAGDIANYRALEASLGISPRRISINEYATPTEIDQPGPVASYIAKFERGGVDNAHRAFWYEYGTVNGLTHNNQPTGSWWLYKWYGDMSGNMVVTTPRAQTGLDGFASHDPTRRIVDVIFGGESGTNYVRVTGLSSLGGTVRVRLESTPASGRYGVVGAATVISDATATVNNGELTVTVPNMSATSGYHIRIQPTSGVPSYQQRYEAENAAIFRANIHGSASASAGAYVGQIDNSGDPRTDSYVDFVVNVPTARSYTMRIGYANGTGATATHGLAYNGGAWSTVSYPATGGWGQFGATVSATVSLRAGHNVIRLAKGSPYFSGGTGYAELDYIELI